MGIAKGVANFDFETKRHLSFKSSNTTNKKKLLLTQVKKSYIYGAYAILNVCEDNESEITTFYKNKYLGHYNKVISNEGQYTEVENKNIINALKKFDDYYRSIIGLYMMKGKGFFQKFIKYWGPYRNESKNDKKKNNKDKYDRQTYWLQMLIIRNLAWFYNHDFMHFDKNSNPIIYITVIPIAIELKPIIDGKKFVLMKFSGSYLNEVVKNNTNIHNKQRKENIKNQKKNFASTLPNYNNYLITGDAFNNKISGGKKPVKKTTTKKPLKKTTTKKPVKKPVKKTTIKKSTTKKPVKKSKKGGSVVRPNDAAVVNLSPWKQAAGNSPIDLPQLLDISKDVQGMPGIGNMSNINTVPKIGGKKSTKKSTKKKSVNTKEFKEEYYKLSPKTGKKIKSNSTKDWVFKKYYDKSRGKIKTCYVPNRASEIEEAYTNNYQISPCASSKNTTKKTTNKKPTTKKTTKKKKSFGNSIMGLFK